MVISHVFSHFRGGHTALPVVFAAGLVFVIVETFKLLKNKIRDAGIYHDDGKIRLYLSTGIALTNDHVEY